MHTCTPAHLNFHARRKRGRKKGDDANARERENVCVWLWWGTDDDEILR